MDVTFKRKSISGYFFNYYEDDRIVFGFTERGFTPRALAGAFPDFHLKELKQVHSDIVLFSSRIPTVQPSPEEPIMEGDGIILDETWTLAVIRTADCTPLFFRDRDYTVGGVVHIGWRGLYKGIEKKIPALLEERSIQPDNLHFYLGPAIEKTCYEVGPDLYEKFSIKKYRENIFSKKPGRETGKYWMDVREGISLSLEEMGVPVQRITKSGLCTFCETDRFPSYRRDKGPDDGNRRLYSFLALKSEDTPRRPA